MGKVGSRNLFLAAFYGLDDDSHLFLDMCCYLIGFSVLNVLYLNQIL